MAPFDLLRFMGSIDTHRANHEPEGSMANNRKYFYDLAHISAALIIAISAMVWYGMLVLGALARVSRVCSVV